MYIINNYEPLTVPEQLEFVPIIKGKEHIMNLDGQKKFQLFINGEPVKCIQTHLNSCMWPPDNYIIPEDRIEQLKQGFTSMSKEFPFEVRNFFYNGFSGQLEPDYAPYTAQFLRWSGDPGVAVMRCSDGKERFIPTFAIEGAHLALPSDNTAWEDKLIFGHASSS